MIRLDVVLIAVLVSTTTVWGRPPLIPKPAPVGHVLLDLSSIHLQLFHEQDAANLSSAAAAAKADAGWSQGISLPNLSMGPLHAQLGPDDNPRAGLSSYKLQGMDQLGSSVWHNQEGRAAKILFVWPTDK